MSNGKSKERKFCCKEQFLDYSRLRKTNSIKVIMVKMKSKCKCHD